MMTLALGNTFLYKRNEDTLMKLKKKLFRLVIFLRNLGEKSKVIDSLYSNVTVISGHKAILVCTFSGSNYDLSLSSSHQLIWIRQSSGSHNADSIHQLIWIRQSSGSHNADSILAHNQDLLISDYRLNIQRTDMDYSLTILDVNTDDEGIYACEVNTQPPQKAYIYLYVQGMLTKVYYFH